MLLTIILSIIITMSLVYIAAIETETLNLIEKIFLKDYLNNRG